VVAPGPIWTPLQVSGGASMEKLEKFGASRQERRLPVFLPAAQVCGPQKSFIRDLLAV
jgi:hypothetical protein